MKCISISDISTVELRSQVIKSSFHKQSLDVHIEYPALFSNSKILRDFIGDITSILNIQDIIKSRLILITDELNNNSIEYWSVEGDINIMRIYFKQKKHSVLLNIEVEDSGNWSCPKTAEQMGKMQKQKKNYKFEDHRSIRGRGLFLIILKIVDKLYFKDSDRGGLIVWITKEILYNK